VQARRKARTPEAVIDMRDRADRTRIGLAAHADASPPVQRLADLRRSADAGPLQRQLDALNEMARQREDRPKMPIQAPGAAPLQRYVADFSVDTETYDPPVTDLLNELDANWFTASWSAVRGKITSDMNNKKKTATKVPTAVSADLVRPNKARPQPSRNTYYSTVIGSIGRDEFQIKTGISGESFEGGHLVPHAMWEHDDNDVSYADSYENLVPMSRTMNVGDWADREDRFAQKLKSIKKGDTLRVDIDIDRDNYSLSLGRAAQLFGLTGALKGTAPLAQEMELYGWLPKSISPSWNHIETGSDDEFSDVEENVLRDTHRDDITTGPELIDYLKEVGKWDSIDPGLQGKLTGL